MSVPFSMQFECTLSATIAASQKMLTHFPKPLSWPLTTVRFLLHDLVNRHSFMNSNCGNYYLVYQARPISLTHWKLESGSPPSNSSE